jgi:hypothetical protein
MAMAVARLGAVTSAMITSRLMQNILPKQRVKNR